MKEEQPIFKVTDRRLFNADGSPRDSLPEEKPEAKPEAKRAEKPEEQPLTAAVAAVPTVTSEPVPAVAEAEQTSFADMNAGAEEELEDAELDEAVIPGVEDPASFINFAMSIASNAASSLGLMEHPVSRKREVDLELGKHWIDVLGMLQKKTQGNLTAQEVQIVEGWLADLRMQFVSLTSASPPKAVGFTGRDIIGGK